MPVKVKSETQTKHQVPKEWGNCHTATLVVAFNQIWPAD